MKPWKINNYQLPKEMCQWQERDSMRGFLSRTGNGETMKPDTRPCTRITIVFIAKYFPTPRIESGENLRWTITSASTPLDRLSIKTFWYLGRRNSHMTCIIKCTPQELDLGQPCLLQLLAPLTTLTSGLAEKLNFLIDRVN